MESTVDDQLAVAEAATLARRGDLRAAARAIVGVDSVPALDLAARIHAQSGDLAAADDCWARVQAVAPDHPGAAAGRATVAAIRSGRRPRRPVLRPARVGALGAVAVAGIVAAAVVLAPPNPRPAAAPIAVGARQRADELQRRLDSHAAARRAARAERTAALDAIASRLSQPGVTVRVDADAVDVSFTHGLFRSGTRFTADGRSFLRRFGAGLGGIGDTITVTGWTVPVPGGPQSGGSTTAWDRAAVAAHELAAASGLPLTRFALASGNQAAPPFPDPVDDRTVTIRIAPAGHDR